MKSFFIAPIFFFFQPLSSDGKTTIDQNQQPKESKTMTTNDPKDKTSDFSKHESSRIWAANRKTAWSQKVATVLSSDGTSLPATIYTAEHKASYGTQEEKDRWVMDSTIGVLQVDSGGLRKIWVSTLLMNDAMPASFIEVDGQIYQCIVGGFPVLSLTRNSLPESFQVKELDFTQAGLDKLVNDSIPINGATLGGPITFGVDSFFSYDFSAMLPTSPAQGELILKGISVENGVFCFDVENICYPKRGKIWIDVKKKKTIKAEEITHLLRSKEKIELKAKREFEVLGWRKDLEISFPCVSDKGVSSQINKYRALMDFEKTILGRGFLDYAVVFHVHNKDGENFWIRVRHLSEFSFPSSFSNSHFIEIGDELFACFFSYDAIRFINAGVKIEKPDKKFVFANNVLDELFSKNYARFPNLPYMYSMKNFDLTDYFEKGFFKKGPDYKSPVIEKVTVKDGVFCFELRNLFNNRRGNVWIDPQTFKIVKAEEIVEPPKT